MSQYCWGHLDTRRIGDRRDDIGRIGRGTGKGRQGDKEEPVY
jgi:hypothetical protein